MTSIAALLGLHGFLVLLGQQSHGGLSPGLLAEAAYRTLRLAGLNFPELASETEIPWSLQVARFALPLSAAWLTLSYLGRKLSSPIRASNAARRVGHVVVAGDGPHVAQLARTTRARGYSVNCIVPATDEALAAACEDAGATVVAGDGSDVGALRRAGTAAARTLIAAYGSADRSLEAVLLTEKLVGQQRRPRSEPLTALACLRAGGLRTAIERVSLSTSESGTFELRISSPWGNLARSLLSRAPLGLHCELERGVPVHVLIVGIGELGEEILLQLLRMLHLPRPSPVRISILDRNAEAGLRRALGRHPAIADLCDVDLLALDAPLVTTGEGHGLERLRARGPLAAVYVCLPDDELAWSTAFDLRRITFGAGFGLPQIYVRTARATSLGETLAASRATNGELARIVPFGGPAEVWDYGSLIDEGIDARAQWIHERYRENERANGRDPDLTPGGRPWPLLAEVYRNSSREQADHVEVKLQAVGMRAVPDTSPPAIQFSPEEIELLARAEHARWCAERTLRGYRPGARRDEGLRIHPLLKSYDALNTDEKNKDVRAIQLIPSLLAAEGFAVKRELRVAILSGSDIDPELMDVDAVLKASARLAEPYQDRDWTLVALADDPLSCRAALRATRRPGTGRLLLPGAVMLLCPGSCAAAREQAVAENRVSAFFDLIKGVDRWIEVEDLAGAPKARALALATRVDLILTVGDCTLTPLLNFEERLRAVAPLDLAAAFEYPKA